MSKAARTVTLPPELLRAWTFTALAAGEPIAIRCTLTGMSASDEPFRE